MISASTALDVIWLPQVGPTSWIVMLAGRMWNAFSIALATPWVTVLDSVPVCAVHWWSSPLEVSWMVASPPPAQVMTREIAFWLVSELDGKVKLDPPLNSSEKFRPLTARAIALITTMTPEIAYHSRWRPTKLIETSARYSRPAMPPPAITPPSR